MRGRKKLNDKSKKSGEKSKEQLSTGDREVAQAVCWCPGRCTSRGRCPGVNVVGVRVGMPAIGGVEVGVPEVATE
jgi:hypothetical protein